MKVLRAHDYAATAPPLLLEPPNIEQVLSAQEAALYLRVHVKTLRRFAREGRVPCAKVGKHYRFQLSELDRWLRRQHNEISRPFRVESGDDLEIHA